MVLEPPGQVVLVVGHRYLIDRWVVTQSDG
jgi:hypothetical protein